MQQAAVIAKESVYYQMPPAPVVRRISPKKTQRLRVAWFLLGLIAGLILSLLISGLTALITHHSTDYAESETPTRIASTLLDASEAMDRIPDLLPKPAKTKPEPPQGPMHVNVKVDKGDTLSKLLTRQGAGYAEAHEIIQALKPHYNPRQIVEGQELELVLNPQARAGQEENHFAVQEMKIRLSTAETLSLKQDQKGEFNIANVKAELTEELASGGGVITSSLYQTGVDSGVPPAILGALINAYSYDVDFQREIKSGDKFNVLFETLKTEQDEVAGYGKLLYATLTLRGEEKKIYSFTRSNGDTGYYDERGQSIRKALLRTPVNGARLSSGFGMRRHPILGYGRMHKGVDFAAPRGTPVYAAGDATVEYAGRRGSFGNYVRLRHNNEYDTAYAHLQKVATRSGKRVKQGDIIGYVGSTGASTGPHLHYEVLKHGKQVNPKDVKFPTGHKLEGQELASFQENIKQIQLVASRLIDGEPKLAAAE